MALELVTFQKPCHSPIEGGGKGASRLPRLSLQECRSQGRQALEEGQCHGAGRCPSITALQPLADPRGQRVAQDRLPQGQPLKVLSRVPGYRTDPEGHRETVQLPDTNWMHLTSNNQEILQSATLLGHFPETSCGPVLSLADLAGTKGLLAGMTAWGDAAFPRPHEGYIHMHLLLLPSKGLILLSSMHL